MASIGQLIQRQEAQQRKEATVCADYTALKEEYPNVSAHTLFDTLAEKYRKQSLETPGLAFPTTGMGIRDVLIRNGLYTPKRKIK